MVKKHIDKFTKKSAEVIEWLLEKRKKQKNITVIIFSQVYLFLLALAITFIIFRQLVPYMSDAFELLFGEATSSDMMPRFWVSFLIVFALCQLLYLITFFPYVPLFILYPLITVAGVANLAKINFRNEPIVFNDLLLGREIINIASQYDLDLEPWLRLLISVFTVLLILPLFVRRVKFRRRNIIKRLICGGAATVITVTFFAHMIIAQNTLIERVVAVGVWLPVREAENNGFILKFMMSVKRSVMFAPPDYNRTNAREFALALGYPENHVMAQPPEILPNVIVIMNESFWETNNLTGVAFNRDPLESLRGIMEATGNPRLLVPHIGGGTSNIEYEFLTGSNIIFYPPGSMIYQQYISRRRWSLAWYFREFGYVTTAIHPYYDWFWRRNTVYPLLGFENIFFDDGSLHYIDRIGRFITDQAVAWEIISRYQQFSQNGELPIFTFAVTMQNHGPYYRRYFGDNHQIYVTNSFEETPTTIVETFAEGIRFAGEAFIYLTEYFANVERPTYIIMFGDHSPTPVANMHEFYALTADGGLTDEENFNRYVTPIIVWSNHRDPQRAEEVNEIARNIGTVTSQMLIVELFNITGMPKPAYVQMLANIMETTRGFNRFYKLDAYGNHSPAHDFSDAPNIRAIYEKLRVVQYDATMGRGYFVNQFTD